MKINMTLDELIDLIAENIADKVVARLNGTKVAATSNQSPYLSGDDPRAPWTSTRGMKAFCRKHGIPLRKSGRNLLAMRADVEAALSRAPITKHVTPIDPLDEAFEKSLAQVMRRHPKKKS